MRRRALMVAANAVELTELISHQLPDAAHKRLCAALHSLLVIGRD
jgi:hypothetical protein